MSLTANNAIRCDVCGKISRNPIGEYTRPDKSAGYIRPMEFIDPTDLSDQDICDECAAKRKQP